MMRMPNASLAALVISKLLAAVPSTRIIANSSPWASHEVDEMETRCWQTDAFSHWQLAPALPVRNNSDRQSITST